MARSRRRGSDTPRPPGGGSRRPRPTRDYIAAYARHQSRRRSEAYTQEDTVGAYLKRMARKQRQAQEAGVPFSAQRARGHVEREHVYRRQREFIRDVAPRLPGPDMLKAEDHWSRLSEEHRQRIIEARRFAMSHKGIHDWSWYQRHFRLIAADKPIFAYHV